MATFNEFLLNIEKEMSDNEHLKEFKVLEREPETNMPKVYYMQFEIPFKGTMDMLVKTEKIP